MSRGGPKANKRRANARKRALDALVTPQTQKDLQGLKFGTGELREHIARDTRQGDRRKRKANATGERFSTHVSAETQQDLRGLVVGLGTGEEQEREQLEEGDVAKGEKEAWKEQQQQQVEDEHAGEADIQQEGTLESGDVKQEEIKEEAAMDVL